MKRSHVRRSIRYRRHCRYFLLRLYFDMGETLPNKFHGLRNTDEPVDSDVEGDEDIGRLEVRSAQHSKRRSRSSSSRSKRSSSRCSSSSSK